MLQCFLLMFAAIGDEVAKSLTAGNALRIMHQVMHLAAQHHQHEPVSICVMGADKTTICSVRMDGACDSTVAHAEGKARTALVFRRDTREFARGDWSAEDLANARSAMPGFVSWGGGVLLHLKGAIVGAVAVSGLTEEADHQLAVGGVREWDTECS